MAANRERRWNAGRKMAQLLATADHSALLKEDEFYLNNYGGFNEEKTDLEFEAPQQSESDDDVVDSDFDDPEEDEDDDDDNNDNDKDAEEDDAKLKKRRLPYKPQNKGKTGVKSAAFLAKRREIALKNVAQKKMESLKKRPRKYVVLTQEQLLEEAKITEKKNLESLKNFQEYELELKKKQQNSVKKRRKIQGPRISSISLTMQKLGGEGECEERTLVEFSEDKLFQEHFAPIFKPKLEKEMLKKREKERDEICCISGEKARYKDPLTGLFYANVNAFRQIRREYDQFLEKNQANFEGEQLLAVQNYLEWKRKII